MGLSSIQMVFKYRTIWNPTFFDHSNTELVGYSDPTVWRQEMLILAQNLEKIVWVLNGKSKTSANHSISGPSNNQTHCNYSKYGLVRYSDPDVVTLQPELG